MLEKKIDKFFEILCISCLRNFSNILQMDENALDTKKARDDSIDRLSNLPDSVLLKILSFLKAREIAQTRILSKRWLKLWSFAPCLCFDIADFLDRDAGKVTDAVLEKFRNFVTSFLLTRDDASEIHTFRLLCPGITCVDFNVYQLKCQQGYHDVDSEKIADSASTWVFYALKHNPKMLEVSFSGDYSLNLPNCLFTCKTLEDVNMCFDTRDYKDLGPATVCLPKLKTLNLSYALFYNDNLEKVLSGCPALESLSLNGCIVCNFSSCTVKKLQLLGCMTDKVTISVPEVEILEFDVDMETKITLKDASKVTQATITSYGYDLDLEDMYRCNLLGSLSGVQHLLIDTIYLKRMLERELPKCPTFVRLKNLTLGAFCMGCVFDSICSFLNHCPKLEMLTLLHTKDTCEKRWMEITLKKSMMKI